MDITLTLDETEIQDAIKDFVASRSPVTITGGMEVNFVASKGAAGNAAVVKIVERMLPADKIVEDVPVAKVIKKTKGKDVTPPVEVAEVEAEAEVEVSDGLKAAMDDTGDSIFGELGSLVASEAASAESSELETLFSM